MTSASTLYAEVIARLGEPVRSELANASGAADRLVAIVAEGAAAWPDVPVAIDAWVNHFAQHLAEGELGAQLAEHRSADAHIALACLAGSARALAIFDQRLRGVAPQALSGIRLDRLSLEELLQVVREKLLVAEPGATPKLATYSARGPLDGWLRVTIARAALSILRTRDPDAARSDDADAIVNRAAEDDPALETLRQRCAPVLKRAIEATLAGLPAEDRTLLRLHFVDGLTIDDLAVIYQVHRATTARRLARVRTTILEDARARAMNELGIGATEFESLMGAMLSRIDLTLGRFLTK